MILMMGQNKCPCRMLRYRLRFFLSSWKNISTLILTHSPYGEYTRHLRHEETGRAVISLWEEGCISATEIWMFAYEDGGKRYLPRPIKAAHRVSRTSRRYLASEVSHYYRTLWFRAGELRSQNCPKRRGVLVF